MRPILFGLATWLVGGGLAWAQVAPNPNLPGGGASLSPGAAGGMTGSPPGGSSNIGNGFGTVSPLGQGNLPSTRTSNIGPSASSPAGGPAVPSTQLNAPSTMGPNPSSNVGTSSSSNPPTVPSATLNNPGSSGAVPSSSFTNPSTSGPSNLGAPMATPPNTSAGPGTTGGVPSTTP